MFESSQNDFVGTPQNFRISVKFSIDLFFFFLSFGPPRVEISEGIIGTRSAGSCQSTGRHYFFFYILNASSSVESDEIFLFLKIFSYFMAKKKKSFFFWKVYFFSKICPAKPAGVESLPPNVLSRRKYSKHQKSENRDLAHTQPKCSLTSKKISCKAWGRISRSFSRKKILLSGAEFW